MPDASATRLTVRLFDWFESKDKYYLVFELASGGDLFSRIWSDGKFTEADAASIIVDILASLFLFLCSQATGPFCSGLQSHAS